MWLRRTGFSAAAVCTQPNTPPPASSAAPHLSDYPKPGRTSAEVSKFPPNSAIAANPLPHRLFRHCDALDANHHAPQSLSLISWIIVIIHEVRLHIAPDESISSSPVRQRWCAMGRRPRRGPRAPLDPTKANWLAPQPASFSDGPRDAARARRAALAGWLWSVAHGRARGNSGRSWVCWCWSRTYEVIKSQELLEPTRNQLN
jgi:hypothetical protein